MSIRGWRRRKGSVWRGRELRRWRFRPPASFEEPSVDSGAVSGVLRGASVVLRRFEMRRKGDDGECRGCGPRCGARRRSRRSEMIVGPVWEKFGVGGKQRERESTTSPITRVSSRACLSSFPRRHGYSSEVQPSIKYHAPDHKHVITGLTSPITNFGSSPSGVWVSMACW